MAHRTQENTLLIFTGLLYKMQIDSQMKRYIGRGPKGSWVQGFLSPWSWGVPPSRHVVLFTTWKLSKPLHLGCFFFGGSVTWAWLIKSLAIDDWLNHQPFPSLENETESSNPFDFAVLWQQAHILKLISRVPSRVIWLIQTQVWLTGLLGITKDALDLNHSGNTRVLGALQELGRRPNVYFLLYHSISHTMLGSHPVSFLSRLFLGLAPTVDSTVI